MSMNGAVLDLRRGRVVLGGSPVLDEVDFRLGRGEFVALLGENGSGKTTLVRSLLGLLPLSSGRVELFGEPLESFRDWSRIGYVPQRFTAASGVPATVWEVALSGRVSRAGLLRPYSRADREEVARALEAVGLTELASKSVATLSGGQQQRVLIARALATDPDLLVLDEPVSSVDVEHQEAFAKSLGAASSRGRSVLLVAHALGAMEPLVTRVVVLAGGRVVHDGAVPVGAEEFHVHHRPAAERGTGAYRRTAEG
jgi:zinc transport system ATP-binding protein